MTGQLAWTVQEELETLLDDSGHLRTLAFLYASKGISSKALAIWRVLARNYSIGLWKDPTLENDIQDTSNNGISSKEIVAIEASKILEESSDQDLVLQHLGWVANINQVLAVQVLTSEKRANQLSPDEVIPAIDPRKVEIFQRYVHHIHCTPALLQYNCMKLFISKGALPLIFHLLGISLILIRSLF